MTSTDLAEVLKIIFNTGETGFIPHFKKSRDALAKEINGGKIVLDDLLSSARRYVSGNDYGSAVAVYSAIIEARYAKAAEIPEFDKIDRLYELLASAGAETTNLWGKAPWNLKPDAQAALLSAITLCTGLVENQELGTVNETVVLGVLDSLVAKYNAIYSLTVKQKHAVATPYRHLKELLNEA